MAKRKEGPDQARSWAIAMAGCVINSLMSGISRTTGIFYVALIQTYGVSRMEANIPFTLRNITRNLAGPLVGMIGQRYGAREITLIGGILASLGIGLCCFAPNVTWIAVLWGGMHGTGVALGNTLFPVIVNQYFLKYRATASGISLSGACIGSFVFPVVLQILIRDMGLASTFLITGSFIMHVLPAAILLTEPSWVKRKSAIERNDRYKGRSNQIKGVSHAIQKLDKIGEDEVASVVQTQKISSPDVLSEEERKADDGFQPVTRSARVFSRYGVDNPAFVGSQADISDKREEQVEEEFFQEIRVRTISIGETSLAIPEQSCAEVQETSIKRGMILMIRDPMFYVISMSLAGFAMLFDPSITVIVDYIRDKGLEEADAKYFISTLSLGDLVGRLCFGWVTDRNHMTVARFMLLLHVLQGVCFLLLPLFYRFDVLMIIIVMYGLASGANLVMYPILIAKYLATVQSLTIGFISVFTGILSFAIPPLIGYFRDNAGSYDGMFMITGSLSVVVGFLWLFEPLFLRLHRSQSEATVIIS